MMTVGLDGAAVEHDLRSGRLDCPELGCEALFLADDVHLHRRKIIRHTRPGSPSGHIAHAGGRART
ncbi:MAG: hypothetical protein ACRDVZ_14765 [Jiangellaceae bacterium]